MGRPQAGGPYRPRRHVLRRPVSTLGRRADESFLTAFRRADAEGRRRPRAGLNQMERRREARSNASGCEPSRLIGTSRERVD